MFQTDLSRAYLPKWHESSRHEKDEANRSPEADYFLGLYMLAMASLAVYFMFVAFQW